MHLLCARKKVWLPLVTMLRPALRAPGLPSQWKHCLRAAIAAIFLLAAIAAIFLLAAIAAIFLLAAIAAIFLLAAIAAIFLLAAIAAIFLLAAIAAIFLLAAIAAIFLLDVVKTVGENMGKQLRGLGLRCIAGREGPVLVFHPIGAKSAAATFCPLHPPRPRPNHAVPPHPTPSRASRNRQPCWIRRLKPASAPGAGPRVGTHAAHAWMDLERSRTWNPGVFEGQQDLAHSCQRLKIMHLA